MDYTRMSKAALLELGFRQYNEASNLMLVPDKLYEEIPNGTTLTSIFGEKVVKGTDYIDLDTRFGLLAFGIIPEN